MKKRLVIQLVEKKTLNLMQAGGDKPNYQWSDKSRGLDKQDFICQHTKLSTVNSGGKRMDKGVGTNPRVAYVANIIKPTQIGINNEKYAFCIIK